MTSYERTPDQVGLKPSWAGDHPEEDAGRRVIHQSIYTVKFGHTRPRQAKHTEFADKLIVALAMTRPRHTFP